MHDTYQTAAITKEYPETKTSLPAHPLVSYYHSIASLNSFVTLTIISSIILDLSFILLAEPRNMDDRSTQSRLDSQGKVHFQRCNSSDIHRH